MKFVQDVAKHYSDYEFIGKDATHSENFWKFENYFPERYFSYQASKYIIKKFRSYLQPTTKVLDFGCGSGFFLENLIKSGIHAAGYEQNNDSVRIVNNKFSKYKCFQGVFSPDTIQNIADKFDVVFILEVIEHLYAEDRHKVFTIIKKITKPGSIIIASVPNDEDLAASFLCCPGCGKIYHRWQHIYSWNKESVAKVFQDEQLTVKDIILCNIKHTGLSPYNLLKRLRSKLYSMKPDNLFIVAKV